MSDPDNPDCHCGHTQDEHELQKNGCYADCQVEDCDCIYFEENQDAEDE